MQTISVREKKMRIVHTQSQLNYIRAFTTICDFLISWKFHQMKFTEGKCIRDAIR